MSASTSFPLCTSDPLAAVATSHSDLTAAMAAMTVDEAEAEQSMEMDIDSTTAAAARNAEDLDLLAMDLDSAFQGLGSSSSLRSPPSSASLPAPAPTQSWPRSRRGVLYYYDYEGLSSFINSSPSSAEIDYAILRRNVRHIDSFLRSLAKEPYPVRRAAIRDLYKPFTHMSRVIIDLNRRGLLDEGKADVGPYIRHIKNLKPIVMAFGGSKLNTEFGGAVQKLERMRLPTQNIIRLKKTKRFGSNSTTSSPGMDVGMDCLRQHVQHMFI